jgi:hypothetical protein
MSEKFTISETINTLKAIFEKHKNERVCVLGTMCVGKTTMLSQLSEYNCIDMDDEFWPQISKKQTQILSQKPITEEIIGAICKLISEKTTVKIGHPLFGISILDCEAVVYLDISLRLLEKHCQSRGDTTLEDALFVKNVIENDWNNHKSKGDKTFYYLTITE